MTTLQAPRTRVLVAASVAWSLVAGGIAFFVGGGMHPKEDPPDVTLKEHLHLMLEDPLWYPAHAVLLLGMVLMTVAFVQLVRGGAYAPFPGIRTALKATAVAAVLGTADMVLHVIVKVQDEALVAGDATPLIDVHLAGEAITLPLFGLAVAWLAVLGAMHRVFGNWVIAVVGVLGGVTYALAGGTFWFTDALDPLFPMAGLIGVWAVAMGVWLLRRSRQE